jgi:hypothetical protein
MSVVRVGEYSQKKNSSSIGGQRCPIKSSHNTTTTFTYTAIDYKPGQGGTFSADFNQVNQNGAEASSRLTKAGAIQSNNIVIHTSGKIHGIFDRNGNIATGGTAHYDLSGSGMTVLSNSVRVPFSVKGEMIYAGQGPVQMQFAATYKLSKGVMRVVAISNGNGGLYFLNGRQVSKEYLRELCGMNIVM